MRREGLVEEDVVAHQCLRHRRRGREQHRFGRPVDLGDLASILGAFQTDAERPFGELRAADEHHADRDAVPFGAETEAAGEAQIALRRAGLP